MTDWNFTPWRRKPFYYDPIPLYSLTYADTLTVNYAGEFFFVATNAPIATLSGYNTVWNNAFLASYDSAFWGVGGYNTINNNGGIDTHYAIGLDGDYNSIVNKGDIIAFYDDAVAIDGDNFYILNTRLINSNTGIGLNIYGDHGAIVSDGTIGLAGAIHGKLAGISLIGSFNKIRFGSSGRIITDEASVDGSPDSDGAGDGLLLFGNNNDVQLNNIIAGHRGVTVGGNGNLVVLGPVNLEYEGAPATDGGSIQARIGAHMFGAYNTLVNHGTIYGTELGMIAEGDQFKIHNLGTIKSDTSTAVSIGGSNGVFQSHGAIEGGNLGVTVSGFNNTIYARDIRAGSGAGAEFSGDGNLIVLDTVTAGSVGAFINGNNNYLELIGPVTAGTSGVIAKGDMNRISLSLAEVSGTTGIFMEGADSQITTTGIGLINGSDQGVIINGNRYNLYNEMAILGEDIGVQAHGETGEITNKGTIGGEAGLVIVGHDLTFKNYGKISGTTRSLDLSADHFFISNSGEIAGSVVIEGRGDGFSTGLFMNSGTITSNTSALSFKTNELNFDSTGSYNSRESFLVVNGSMNDLTFNYGAAQTSTGVALDLTGDDNDIHITPFMAIDAGGTFVAVKGNSNTFDVADWAANGEQYQAAVDSKGDKNKFIFRNSSLTREGMLFRVEGDNNEIRSLKDLWAVKGAIAEIWGANNLLEINGTAAGGGGGVVMNGYGSHLIADARLSCHGRAFDIRGNAFNIELRGSNDLSTGTYSGSTVGLWVEGDSGRIQVTQCDIEGGENGFVLSGNDNLDISFSDLSNITSRSGSAALISGNGNDVVFDNLITESTTSAALVLKGVKNRIVLDNAVAARNADTAISVEGHYNKIFVRKLPGGYGGAVKSGEKGIVIKGGGNTIDNEGAIYSRSELHGFDNKVHNRKELAGVSFFNGQLNITNETGGIIHAEKAVAGSDIDFASINNSGAIKSTKGDAIHLVFTGFSIKSSITNSAGMISGSLAKEGSEAGLAIHIEGNVDLELSNLNGDIEGSVLLGRGNDVIVNTGNILGRTYRTIEHDGVTEKVLVALEMGDGQNVLNLDAQGDIVHEGTIWGEIWGGNDKDIINGGASSNVIRGFAGNDSITGGKGADTIYGGEGDDVIVGSGGNGYLDGGDDTDHIWSEIGNNTLNGGEGDDSFFISHAIDEAKTDIILDFVSGEDQLTLDRRYFTNVVGDVKIDADSFAYMGSIFSLKTRIIYDQATGDLYYDPDGSLSDYNAVKFAHLKGAPNLTADDIGVSVWMM